MVESGGDPIRVDLDDFVRAFEEAYARDGHASIADFLPPPDSPLHLDVLRELVRVDLEYGWARGRPRALADYEDAFPRLRDDPQGLREILRDESRLRREAKERALAAPLGGSITVEAPHRGGRGGTVAWDGFRDPPSQFDPDDLGILASWQEWPTGDAGHDDLLRDLFRSDPRGADRLIRGTSALPRVGEVFAGFRLIAELGRGTFGRVYLAHQGDLADRPVALKVSPRLFEEARSLAQLQHTNIVPIYSTHRVGPFQALCMPFFGSSTLKDVGTIIGRDGTLPSSGQFLLTALRDRKGREDSGPAGAEEPTPPAEGVRSGTKTSPGPATATETLKKLERLTYVQAILWIVSRLADGLAHAHERGILHRDLKPANILLTDDGQPMLLDFNLSASADGNPDAMAVIGGTLPYMAPEHLDACRGADRPVDARSDVYSLGIILYELLTGRPFSSHSGPSQGVIDRLIADRLGPPPDPRRWNKAVTPAVASIVARCLQPDPSRRYQSAADLREDLERHLADLPLKHAPEPSIRERTTKWARRHPTLCGSASIALLGLVLVASLGAAIWLLARDLSVASARNHRIDFRATFAECQLRLNTGVGPSDHLERGVELAGRALHEYGLDVDGGWSAAPLIRDLPDAERGRLLEELSELAQLRARALVALADSDEDRRRALEAGVLWLDRAERFDPHPSAALYEDRARYHDALGRKSLADRDRRLASRTSPASARDFDLMGTSLLAQGQPDRAEILLGRAVALDPRRFWAWFALGICHSDQGRHPDAAHDFSVCTTLEPEFAWAHLNRGLALARSGRLTDALAAYERALTISPDLAEAHLDRALTLLELGDPSRAIEDLDRAIARGLGSPGVLATRASALSRLGLRDEAERAFASIIRAHPGDPMPLVARGFSRLEADVAGASGDFAQALRLDPDNARALLGKAHLLRPEDPRAALSLVGSALDADPDLGDAIQLRALILARLGDPAAEADVDRLLRTPTSERLYNASCALSLLSRSADASPRLVDRALDLLLRALAVGFPASRLADDPDLDPLRASPRFPRTPGLMPRDPGPTPSDRSLREAQADHRPSSGGLAVEAETRTGLALAVRSSSLSGERRGAATVLRPRPEATSRASGPEAR